MVTRRRVLVGTGILLCLLAAGPILLAWRLARGPIMVPWIAERVSAAITPPDGALTVTAASASIGWDSIGHRVDLRIHSVEVRGPNHEMLIRLPTLGVNLDPWALARARVAAREVEFLHPHVTLLRSADGTFDFHLGDAPAPGSDDALIETITAALRAGGLHAVAVRDGTLTITDEGSRSTWTADHVTLSLRLQRDGLATDFGFEIPMAGKPATFEGDALHRPGHGVRVRLVVAGVVPNDLAGAPFPIRSLEVPVAGTVRVDFDESLRILETTADLVTERGSIRLPTEFADTIAVERMTVRASYAREADSLTVDATVRTETGADFDLEATFVEIASTPIGTMTLTTDELTPTAVVDLWPSGVAAGARRWLVERVSTGRFRNVRGHMALTGHTIDEVHLDLTFHDFEVRYHATLPPLTDAAGHGACTLSRCTATLTAGAVDGVSVAGSEIVLSGLASKAPAVLVNLVVDGPTARMLAVLDHEPLGYAQRLGVDPKRVGGTLTGEATLRVPLAGPDRTPVVRAATVSLADFEAPDVQGRWDVTDGALDITIAHGTMNTRGSLSVQGVPARITWREPLADGSALRQVRVEASIARAAREALGVDPGSWLTGPVAVNALLDQQTPSRSIVHLDLDLSQAQLDLPIAALAKRPGEPGHIDTTLTLDGGRLRRINALRAQVKASTFTGHATRRSDGSGWETARVEALLATSAHDDQRTRCTFDLSSKRDGSRFSFVVDDLGHFVRAIGRRFAARGGSLTWKGTARLDDAGQRIDGQLEASSYVITRSPQLARIATLSSISGIEKALRGEGISIEETRARLTYRAGRLRLEDGFMIGPPLALYAEGSWDLSGPTIDLEGDLAPSYFGTNRALNRVPLVGRTLTGGGKGLHALHFNVRGPAGDPNVSVSKVASLAPGPLRRLLQRATR